MPESDSAESVRPSHRQGRSCPAFPAHPALAGQLQAVHWCQQQNLPVHPRATDPSSRGDTQRQRGAEGCGVSWGVLLSHRACPIQGRCFSQGKGKCKVSWASTCRAVQGRQGTALETAGYRTQICPCCSGRGSCWKGECLGEQCRGGTGLAEPACTHVFNRQVQKGLEWSLTCQNPHSTENWV